MLIKYQMISAALVFATLGSIPSRSLAEGTPERYGILNLTYENDIFANQDRRYTNGVRGSWTVPQSRLPYAVQSFADAMPFFESNGRERLTYSFGQTMFTPDNISTLTPPPGDRPYAGWLYGGVELTSDLGDRLDSLRLQMGVVGPSALAEPIQDFVHRNITDSPRPKGWDSQLKDELGVNLSYERKWKSAYKTEFYGLGFDATPNLGASLGNVYTYAASGLTLRFGQYLPNDYGPPRIAPSLSGSDFFVPESGHGWYMFAGVEGRAVARNIFLDGSTFRDSASVDKEVFIGDVQGGLVYQFGENRIAYSHVFRTREYKGQDEGDQFGALSYSRRF